MKKGLKVFIIASAVIAVFSAAMFFSKNLRYERMVEDAYRCVSEIKYSKAYIECEKAVKLFPERMEAYIAYAYLNYAKGDYETAEEKLLEGLKIARDRYAEDGTVIDGTDSLILTLAKYYYEWNRTEDACSLIINTPAGLPGESSFEYLEQLTGPKAELKEDYVIEWKDAEFERLIRKLIGKADGDIMASDVWNITCIEIWGNEIVTGKNAVTEYDKDGFYLNGSYVTEKGGIKSLDDLTHFINIESVSVNFQKNIQISFFTENYDLSRLRKLSLVGNGIFDIKPLMWTTRLTTLNLDYNVISNFLWISRLYDLNYLSVKGNKAFYSTELFESMESLDYLDISEMSRYDTEKISEIPYLTELVIDYGDDLTFIAFCDSLKKLTIKTDAAGMYNVVRVTGLTELNLTLTEPVSLEDLTALKFLKKLSVSNESGEIVDLGFISGMVNLTELSLGEGDFGGYDALAKNTAVKSVVLPYGGEKKYEEAVKYFPSEYIRK